MRLRDYLLLLQNCSNSLLEYTYNDKIVGGVKQIVLRQFKKPMQMVNELDVNNLFENKTQQILKHYDYLITTVNQEILMDKSTFSTFDARMKSLQEYVVEFKNVLENIVPKENKNTINFKLPNDIDNIEQFNKFVKELNDSLKFCQKLKIEPKFNGLDTGSSWFQFIIDSTPTIIFIFSLLIGFLKTAKLYLETEKLWNERIEREKAKKTSAEKIQYLEQLKEEELNEHRNEERKIIQENIEKIGIEKLFGEQSEKLKKDIGQINEFVNVVDISMRKMVELLERGMEIQPAITANEETKAISKNIKEQLSAYQRVAIGMKDVKAIETELKEEIDDNQ